MSAWTCRSTDGKAADKIVPPRLRIPYWKGPGAESEEKHEPASDTDTATPVDSLKVLDPKRPIREADIFRVRWHVSKVPNSDMALFIQWPRRRGRAKAPRRVMPRSIQNY